jgi:hypothetical protein
MRPDHYQNFTERLCSRLEGAPEVVGLVAVGSMSGDPPPPDEWSDHDFFVVVAPGSQERFRSRLDWLPDAGEVALSFRETAHGVKVLYRSAHLLEFAVFGPEELSLARVNRYRVLLDRADVAARMRALREETARAGRGPDDAWLCGQLLTALLVGAGRFWRGERLSGQQLVRSAAIGHLLRLIERHLPPERPGSLDDLDPFRRFESAYPALGRELEEALALEVPAAARALLSLATRELGQRLPFPAEGAAAVARFLRARSATPAP